MQDIVASFLAPLMPQLLQLIATVLGLLASVALAEFARRTGIEIKIQKNIEIDQLRDRLDDALRNAAEAAVAKSVADAQGFVVEHLQAGIPDVLAKLGAPPLVLRNRAEAAVKAAKK